ncbi:MAG: AAA family ATPase [Gemmatimonadaceae bacterium]|nr:AAA family ATPase [Gemmatimonadaceae bacterium]
MPNRSGSDVMPLVGRAAELSALNSVLAATAEGTGSTVFLAGEGGVGKTRLVEALAARAAKMGFTVAVGRAYPVETGVPYAAFADALVPVLRAMEPAQLTVLSRGGAAELRHLFPSLGPDGEGGRATAGADPSELKARLLWNFSQFMVRFAAKQPVLLVLENLQWADSSSLELLHFLARQPREGARIAVIGTYNESERDANEALRITEQSLLKIGAVSVHRLEPLREQQIGELLHEKFGVPATQVEGFAALLYDWTRGNPFFIEETLKSLMDRGRLVESDGRWSGWDTESLDLPVTVREVLGARLDRLSPDARAVANFIAVIGTRARYEAVRLVSGLAESELVNAIDELRSARVLDEAGRDDGLAYDFAHPLLREVLYTGLGGARARLMHAQVAQSLESLYGLTAPAHADELAFHYARAQSRDLAPKAVKYLTAAGRTALEKYANREAADYLAAALEHLDREGGEDPGGELVTTLARARQRLGQYDGAMELWSRALSDAERRGDHAREASVRHRMGLACYWTARYSESLEHYAAALGAAAHIADPAMNVRIRLGRSICAQDLGRFDDAAADVNAALADAETVGNPALTARVHRAFLLLHAWGGDIARAKEHGRKAVALADESGQKLLGWSAHWGMAMLSGLDSDAAGVVHHIGAASKLADELRSPLLPLWTAELSVQYASGVGNWETGIATGERAIALARSLAQRTLLPRLLVWTGTIHLWRGDHAKALEMFEEAWKVSGAARGADRSVDIPSVVPAHLGMAAYHLATRNYAEAVKVGEAGLAIADRAGHVVWAVQWLLPLITEAALYNADFATAERHSARLRSESKRLRHRLAGACASASEGLLTLLRDRDPAGAVKSLKQAAEQMEELQYPHFGARMRRQLARAHSEAGNREDAARELRRAHDLFARLGAAAELDATREQLRMLGFRPPAKTIGEGAAGLTAREMEIARMVAGRKANKEIGAALKISARTVSTHLSNIFSKLSVDSRGELADYVREKGLL